jgi:hypothetical protein
MCSAFAQVAEGDRVTQRLHRRDAVLPLGLRRARQEVGRARLRLHVHPLPLLLSYLSPQAEHTWREERDADGLTEDGLVAVPPDACARAVLRDEHVLQRPRLKTGERGGRPLKREQEIRDVISLPEITG